MTSSEGRAGGAGPSSSPKKKRREPMHPAIRKGKKGKKRNCPGAFAQDKGNWMPRSPMGKRKKKSKAFRANLSRGKRRKGRRQRARRKTRIRGAVHPKGPTAVHLKKYPGKNLITRGKKEKRECP